MATTVTVNTGAASSDIDLGKNLANLIYSVAQEINASNKNIATNASKIATNASNIATNTNAINSLTSDVDELKSGWLADPDPVVHFETRLVAYEGTKLN